MATIASAFTDRISEYYCKTTGAISDSHIIERLRRVALACFQGLQALFLIAVPVLTSAGGVLADEEFRTQASADLAAAADQIREAWTGPIDDDEDGLSLNPAGLIAPHVVACEPTELSIRGELEALLAYWILGFQVSPCDARVVLEEGEAQERVVVERREGNLHCKPAPAWYQSEFFHRTLSEAEQAYLREQAERLPRSESFTQALASSQEKNCSVRLVDLVPQMDRTLSLFLGAYAILKIIKGKSVDFVKLFPKVGKYHLRFLLFHLVKHKVSPAELNLAIQQAYSLKEFSERLHGIVQNAGQKPHAELVREAHGILRGYSIDK